MKQYTFKRDGKQWERINKTQARKQFDRGNVIVLCPCNMRPDGFLGCGTAISKVYSGDTFDRCCNNVIYYNCDNERGRYLAFYGVVE